jgi:hypothetical protein
MKAGREKDLPAFFLAKRGSAGNPYKPAVFTPPRLTIVSVAPVTISYLVLARN